MVVLVFYQQCQPKFRVHFKSQFVSNATVFSRISIQLYPKYHLFTIWIQLEVTVKLASYCIQQLKLKLKLKHNRPPIAPQNFQMSWKIDVLLRELKRHTARRVASTWGGVPTLGWGRVPTLAGGTYLGWGGTYLGWGVPTLASRGTYLGLGGGVFTLVRMGIPTLAEMGYPPCGQIENITSRRTTYAGGNDPVNSLKVVRL